MCVRMRECVVCVHARVCVCVCVCVCACVQWGVSSQLLKYPENNSSKKDKNKKNSFPLSHALMD